MLNIIEVNVMSPAECAAHRAEYKAEQERKRIEQEEKRAREEWERVHRCEIEATTKIIPNLMDEIYKRMQKGNCDHIRVICGGRDHNIGCIRSKEDAENLVVEPIKAILRDNGFVLSCNYGYMPYSKYNNNTWTIEWFC